MKRRLRAGLLAALIAATGCATAQDRGPPAAAASVEIARASATVTGQPLGALPAPYEIVVSTTVLPVGGALPMHKHPWPRYAYVESGRLRVHYEQAGLVREFGPGEAVVEAVDQWHEGEVVGPEPVRLLAIDHVPPGQVNVVRR
jgi:quercetin dioxygenase-like cupin family protein